ncbi:MAG: hypothetical protein JO051_03280 [Acidobacteriaceae bacterium]|nr:hypothetical protein [Acidobacteriaceae bacterium]
MRKFDLRDEQMTNAALIDEARGYASKLVLRESRGPGDTENAMRRIEAKYGVPFSALWSLRYRPPKRIWADLFFQLRAAYEAERERQLRLLQHEIDITKAIAGPSANSVVAAEAVVDAS